jgi:hypothetical protein
MMTRILSLTSCALLLAATPAHADATAAPSHRAGTVGDGTTVATEFYGESLDPNAVAGDLVLLRLSPDGTYRRRHCYVTPCIDAPTEIGTYSLSSSAGKALIHFFNDDDDGRYEFDRYEYVLGPSNELWLRADGKRRWVPLTPQPDESLCDASGGHWRDDDPNPYTGLYCDCSQSTYWNAAAGGCVARPQ